MITQVPGLPALPRAAVTALLATIIATVALAGCGPAEAETPTPDLPAVRSGLQGVSPFTDVRSVQADYWENDHGHGTLKVILTVDQGGDAETIADEAVSQIWTRWFTSRVRVIDVVVLGTEDVTYTVQRRYNLPGQTDELVEQFGDPATG
ncbi:MAG: hypothetical protein L0Y54_02040 [Sporichthyaceae bacterium]|nr:hypothetical protein [Sporichthyaceae bacterium]